MAQQYKIPQNLDIEDKILGPFTLKQFLYIIVGGIIVYVLFNIIGTKNLTLFILISLPIAALVLALVFVQINGRPFVDFFFYFSEFLKDPREKKWIKATKIKTFNVTAKMSEDEEANQKTLARLAKRGIVQSQLTQMATLLDTRGWDQGSVTMSDNGPTVTKLVKDDEELDDIFTDIEGAVENLQASDEEESRYGDLEERLKGLVG